MLLSEGCVAKARVKSLSHRECGQAEDARRYEDKEWAMGLGRMTGNFYELESRNTSLVGSRRVLA